MCCMKCHSVDGEVTMRWTFCREIWPLSKWKESFFYVIENFCRTTLVSSPFVGKWHMCIQICGFCTIIFHNFWLLRNNKIFQIFESLRFTITVYEFRKVFVSSYLWKWTRKIKQNTFNTISQTPSTTVCTCEDILLQHRDTKFKLTIPLPLRNQCRKACFKIL